MPAKKAKAKDDDVVVLEETVDADLSNDEWMQLIRAIYDLIEVTPPLGERYEILLRELISKAYVGLGFKLVKPRREALFDEIFNYVASYGPIQKFIDDLQISEIMVNGPKQIFIEKNGEMILTDAQYYDHHQVRFAINHILSPLGRFVNTRHPTIDSRLPDGSRVNIVIPPVSQQGPCITIRKFMKDKLSMEQLISLGSITDAMSEFVSLCVKGRLNIIVAGNTGSGKTTFLNILARYIPDTERLITIEDSAELALIQTHKVSLEAQSPNLDGQGEVTVRQLVRNCLRMRPDRIIVGECRGGETIDMLQAMNTGHDGSMTTIHSNSVRDTLSRLETTALMAGIDMPVNAIRKQIAAAVDVIIYLNRMADGGRKVTQISEVAGMEGDIITTTDIYSFQQTGVDEKGKIKGIFKPTGLRPSFSNKLEAMGLRMDPRLFRQM
jgi:pilus assembly protein CpaF